MFVVCRWEHVAFQDRVIRRLIQGLLFADGNTWVLNEEVFPG